MDMSIDKTPLSTNCIKDLAFRTMYETGRTAQVAREFQRYGLDILGLAKVRWINSGRVTLATGETLLYSGQSGDTAHHIIGVGLMMNKKAFRSLLVWEPVSDRIITARFQSSFQKMTIIQMIQCYAPTNQADPDDKVIFYQQLQSVIDNTARRNIILLIGDMNAKVGSDCTDREFTMGNEGLLEKKVRCELLWPE